MYVCPCVCAPLSACVCVCMCVCVSEISCYGFAKHWTAFKHDWLASQSPAWQYTLNWCIWSWHFSDSDICFYWFYEEPYKPNFAESTSWTFSGGTPGGWPGVTGHLHRTQYVDAIKIKTYQNHAQPINNSAKNNVFCNSSPFYAGPWGCQGPHRLSIRMWLIRMALWKWRCRSQPGIRKGGSDAPMVTRCYSTSTLVSLTRRWCIYTIVYTPTSTYQALVHVLMSLHFVLHLICLFGMIFSGSFIVLPEVVWITGKQS